MRFLPVEKEASVYADACLRAQGGSPSALYAAIRWQQGAFFAVREGDTPIGTVHIDGKTLDALHVLPEQTDRAAAVLDAALQAFGLTAAVVYPPDQRLLCAAARLCPRIAPQTYLYTYGGGAEEVPENPYPKYSDAFMRFEQRLAEPVCDPFARAELRCAVSRDLLGDCALLPEPELIAAVAERRVFVLGEGKAVAVLRDVPYAPHYADVAVWVSPDCRGIGVGRKLLQTAAQLALDYGKTPIACTQKADALLRSAGFTRTAPILKLLFD